MTTPEALTQTTSPQALTESRKQLHYAAQYIAATGAALLEPLPDYSHSSITWHPVLDMFVGTTISVTQPFQVALEPVSLTLSLIDPQNDTIASLPLHGKTMLEGLDWLHQAISKLGADSSKIVFLDYPPPPDDFPDHPLAHGASFDASQSAALQVLAAYYKIAHELLQTIVSTNNNASAIHIWPHHFDIATLITLPSSENGTPLTVWAGLSPGDSSYQVPYWYVSPSPYPEIAQLPTLDGRAFWHTQHWVGAVLQTDPFTENIDAKTQQQQAAIFLEFALKASINLLKSESADAV